MENIVELNKITKKYKGKQALKGIDLTIKKGEIFGLIGKNGAGKTTTLKILAGLIHATDGEGKIFGSKLQPQNQMFERIGSLIETPGFYLKMSGYENLKLKQLYCGTDENLEELIDLVGLKKAGHEKVKNYSLGMRQRLGIAMALVGNPQLLILDEPINGLDPQGILEIRKLLLYLNREKGITIIVSSHILEELTKVATSYAIIEDGMVVKEFSNTDMQSKSYIKIQVDNLLKAQEVLKGMKLSDVRVQGKDIMVQNSSLTSGEINQHLFKNGIMVNEVINVKESIEEIYLASTEGE